MNKRRLLKLADLLEADAKNKKGVKFDLGSWGETPNIAAFTEVTCSTTACAVGLACISGAFKREGLTFKVEENGSIVPQLKYVDPFYSEKLTAIEFDAVERLFDLDYVDAYFLFVDISYPKGKTKGAVGERTVAKRIRDFVAGKVAA